MSLRIDHKTTLRLLATSYNGHVNFYTQVKGKRKNRNPYRCLFIVLLGTFLLDSGSTSYYRPFLPLFLRILNSSYLFPQTIFLLHLSSIHSLKPLSLSLFLFHSIQSSINSFHSILYPFFRPSLSFRSNFPFIPPSFHQLLHSYTYPVTFHFPLPSLPISLPPPHSTIPSTHSSPPSFVSPSGPPSIPRSRLLIAVNIPPPPPPYARLALSVNRKWKRGDGRLNYIGPRSQAPRGVSGPITREKEVPAAAYVLCGGCGEGGREGERERYVDKEGWVVRKGRTEG